MEFHYTNYRSPVGEIHLLASSKGLRALELNRTYHDFYLGNMRRSGGDWIKVKPEAHPVLKQAVQALEAYFKNSRPLTADIPLDLQGTDFQLQVWNALRQIPYGKTNSYGQVAAKIGRPNSPRAVGGACGSNPVSLFVPCHRVVGGNGSLTGFGGGLAVKQNLLEHEGGRLLSNMVPCGHRNCRLILGILALSLFLKLALWSHVVFFGDSSVDFGMMDTRGYHEPALSLVQSGRLDTFLDPPGIPMTYRTPGYPVFLAALYAIFGVNWPVVMLFQAILATITVYLTWRLARKLWNDRVALIAAALVAIDPISLVLSQKLMTENNFALFIMIAVLAGVNLLTEPRRKTGWALLLGTALALATLTRPSSYYLPVPVMLGVLIWGLQRRWKVRTLALSVGMILLPLVLLVGGWIWRNYRVTGVPIYTSIEGYYAYFWQGAEVLANVQGQDISEVQRQLGLGDGSPTSRGDGYRVLHPETRDWNFEQLCVRWQQDGMNIIKSHPVVFARVYFAGVLRALTRPGVNNLLDMMGLQLSALSPHALLQHPLAGFVFAYSYLWLLVVYLGVILYLIKGRRHDSLDVARLFVLGIMLYLILLSGGPSAMARFRVPLIPFFALFCAYQIGQYWNRFSPAVGEK